MVASRASDGWASDRASADATRPHRGRRRRPETVDQRLVGAVPKCDLEASSIWRCGVPPDREIIASRTTAHAVLGQRAAPPKTSTAIGSLDRAFGGQYFARCATRRNSCSASSSEGVPATPLRDGVRLPRQGECAPERHGAAVEFAARSGWSAMGVRTQRAPGKGRGLRHGSLQEGHCAKGVRHTERLRFRV